MSSIPPLSQAPVSAPLPAYPAPRRRIGIFTVLCTIFLLLSLAANAVLFVVLLAFGAAGFGGDGAAAHVQAETVFSGSHDKIVILPIEGIIDGAQVERVRQYCDYIKADSAIKAVIVEVDSPGGGVTSSDEIHHMLAELRDSGKKLVVSMGGLAASGGYYVSMPAEKIYAEPTTLTGSIGVIMQTFDATELMGKIGVTPETVKSDAAEEFKDAGSPFRKWDSGDQEYFKGIVNNAAEKFQKVVELGRKGKLTKPISEIAVGKVWPADKAKDLGSVDEIAYLDEVCDKTARDAGLSNPTIVRLRPKSGLLEAFGASAPGATKVELKVDADALKKLNAGGLEYRYNGVY